MAKEIASVDWSSLDHAFGSAGDLPALLDRLMPDPMDDQWGELWIRICHQGSVYSASFAALPVLAEAAARWLPAQRAQALALAGCILASEGCSDQSGRNLLEIFFQENRAVVRRLQDLCQESLAEPGLTEEDFIDLLQSGRAFIGDRFWGRNLAQLAGGEYTGECPNCGARLCLVIGKYGYFVTSEDWVGRGKSPGVVVVRPDVKQAPIEPASGPLPPIGQWIYDRCHAVGQDGLAKCILYTFGTSKCTACGKVFALEKALAGG